jgi:hypothetical protein
MKINNLIDQSIFSYGIKNHGSGNSHNAGACTYRAAIYFLRYAD